jgi:hypothetical protein
MPRSERLLDRTYRLLGESDLTLREISKRTGLGYEWLKRFRVRAYDDPGVNVVQRLHDFLVLYREAKGGGPPNTEGPTSPPAKHESAAA